MKRILLTPITWALFGCATVDPNAVILTIHSYPEGAKLYVNNMPIGTAPLKKAFRANDQQRIANEIKVAPITAIWPSGANTTTQIHLSLNHGSQQNYTFYRPSGHPDLERDLAAAAQLKQQQTQVRVQQQHDEDISSDGGLIFLQFLGAAVHGYNAGRASASDITPYQPSQGANQPAQVIKKIEAPKSYNCRGTYAGSGQYTCEER